MFISEIRPESCSTVLLSSQNIWAEQNHDFFEESKFSSLLILLSNTKFPNIHKLTQSPSPTIDFNLARAEFRALAVSETSSLQGREDGSTLDLDTIIGSSGSLPTSDVEAAVEKARAYAKRLGVTLKSSPQGHAFINGKHVEIAEVAIRNFVVLY